MNSEDKDDKEALDEDSFFQDDYDEEPIDYDLNTDKFLEEDIFEPDLTKNWDKNDPQEDSPFDDELEFEEEDLEPDLEDEFEEDDLEPDLEDEFEEDDLEPGLEDEFEEENLEDEDDFDHTPERDEPRREPDHEEEWQDDDLDSQDENYSQPWPLGLFAAGIIALLLLAAGGYGVMEQRLETQKEVRLLRAKLATTTSNTEVAESRQTQRNQKIYNEELQAQVEILQAEITALREELSRKNSEAPIQSSEIVSPAPAPEIVEPAAVPEIVKPAAVQEAPTETNAAPPETSIVEDAWFVNFASYKIKATADNWASKLSVSAGRVAVVTGEKKGTLYYRVRVLDLPSKEIAGKIALQLEQTHHLSPRWVGKQ